MAERKVISKYFPPDFDPAKIPRRKMPKDLKHTVRLMTPFSMRCDTCGEFIYKSKKFNARKETVEGEDYLGIKIFRFNIRCPKCYTNITFKTDPKNSDYVCETGATRNYEPWKDEKLSKAELEQQKQEAAEYNPMMALEDRTRESKREMDILDGLDELRTRNARSERVDSDSVLKSILDERLARELKQQDDDDAYARAVFHSAAAEDEGGLVRRVMLDEEEDEDEDVLLNKILAEKKEELLSSTADTDQPATFSSNTKTTTASTSTAVKRSSPDTKSLNPNPLLGVIVKKKKTTTTVPPPKAKPTSLQLLGGYSDSEDGSD